MFSSFTFDGKNSAEFSLQVEKIPTISTPSRRRTVIAVAGRNGDLHIDDGTFENVPQQYACYFHSDQIAPEQAHQIKAWLSHSGEYRRLEDSYDPDYFRLATFSGPMDIANILYVYGRCVINFDCAPQAFLKSGEAVSSFASPGQIYNPTLFPANPLITVYGTSAGEISVGGIVVAIHSIADQITLDCEMQNAYRQVADSAFENCNKHISAPEYPVLLPGNNAVAFSGGITGIDIMPRWWTI